MKEYFSSKKAIQHIADGELVKMVSNDFKTHLFKKGNNFKKPIVHEIKRNIGRPFFTSMDYDEFKDKYKDNEFFVYEEY